MSNIHFVCLKAVGALEQAAIQSGSDDDLPSSLRARSHVLPCGRDVPAIHPALAYAGLNGEPPVDVWSPPPPPGASPPTAAGDPCLGEANIPLHPIQPSQSNICLDAWTVVPLLAACIDMSVTIVQMHIASDTQGANRKKQKTRAAAAGVLSPRRHTDFCEVDGDMLSHPHAHQLLNIVSWHIDNEDAKWYVKPRSTCWFDEYLFKIYTPDMFDDILRMKRRTFDKLVEDLRPFIQGQQTHWRHPIGVEKKVVVTLFKLMHGVSIPLVADKAALGKSTVHGILRQVCSAISIHFGHLISWPSGRRLAHVTAAFQAKQWMPNCIGAIDGSHVYIAAPPNSIVAADHHNRYKTFSILLQAVVDTKCYFTSVNTGPPGSLHDSAHFKATELYRKVEAGVMGGFHDDPLTWPAALPFPPYIVADRGFPLLSWCMTPFKIGPMGVPLTDEEVWFNRKHSSTRMCVERGFGLLKARFKEIGTKTALKLNFVPTVVHSCCVLHNILLASKDRTLDQILRDCELPPMEDNDTARREDDGDFHPPRRMGLLGEDRALLEGKLAREDLLDYLVRVQNADHIARSHR